MSPSSRALAALTAAMLTASSPSTAQTVAIIGGTIFPVTGPKVEDATIVMRDGRIVAVGEHVVVPPGATRLDASGKWITPGLFHAATDVGVNGISSLVETREGQDSAQVSASFNVAEGIDPAAVQIPVARLAGVTTALIVPSDGLIAGQAVIADLAGDRIEEMLVRSPAAMVADVSQSSKAAGGGSRAGVMQRLRQILRDASEYARRREDFRRGRIQPLAATAADLEALQPVLRGTLPLYVLANRRSDIENALRLRQEFRRIQLVIRGGIEAWQVAPALASAGVPVAVEARVDVPTFDALAPRLDNAALLAKAGVALILVEGGPQFNYPTNPGNLREVAGNAVREGLPWDAALRAVTLAPSQAFGVGDRYGSIEPGKVADVVVWSGDPFELSTQAERVFIRGREQPLESRMTELLRRYRTLPPSYLPAEREPVGR